MRIPGYLLDKSITYEAPKGSTPSGTNYDTPKPIACHYEDKAALKVDERTESPTAGTLITMNTQVIGQLDRTLQIGARITYPSGEQAILSNLRHYEHTHTPNNTEFWTV